MILGLTPPPSVNELYPTVNGRRIKSWAYKSWIGASLWEIKMQHPKPLLGPCAITLTVPENGRRDLDGYIKATLDLLVLAKLIEGDRNKTVRELHLAWHEQPAMVVEIQPHSGRGSSKTSGRRHTATKSKPKDG